MRDAWPAITMLAVILLGAFRADTEPRVIELTISGGRLPAAQRVIRVRQGDDVELRWTADAPVTLHLHGYDIEKMVTPHAPATMRFPARATGRFPITIHRTMKEAETTLGYLEVHPR